MIRHVAMFVGALWVVFPALSRAGDHGNAPAPAPAPVAAPTGPALPTTIAAPALLMREVRVLEDRMAQGDEQAFRRRVELIRSAAITLRSTPSTVWSEPRNWRALIAYVLGGGDVRLVKELLLKGDLKDVDKTLLRGIMSLAEAREEDALKDLVHVDISKLEIGLAAPLALAVAPPLAKQNWQRARDLLEDVVLRAPGTLMEESALRRLAMLYLTHGEPARAFAAFSRHIRRFPQSIFSEQARKSFAAELVAKPEERETWALVEAGCRTMGHDGAMRLYLEIAEGSLRKGKLELARNASTEALKRVELANADVRIRTRAKLFQIVSEVPSTSGGATLKALAALKSEELTPSDRHLASVAEQLARAIGDNFVTAPGTAAGPLPPTEDQLKRARSLLSASNIALAKGPK